MNFHLIYTDFLSSISTPLTVYTHHLPRFLESVIRLKVIRLRLWRKILARAI